MWFCFISLRDWSRKLAPVFEPIRVKTETNLNLVTCVSRLPGSLPFFPLSSNWLMMKLILFLNDYWDKFGFGFQLAVNFPLDTASRSFLLTEILGKCWKGEPCFMNFPTWTCLGTFNRCFRTPIEYLSTQEPIKTGGPGTWQNFWEEVGRGQPEMD